MLTDIFYQPDTDNLQKAFLLFWLRPDLLISLPRTAKLLLFPPKESTRPISSQIEAHPIDLRQLLFTFELRRLHSFDQIRKKFLRKIIFG